ncbi:ankyrin repeat-containing domain protein [Xylaria longipes]|nr:ankyrin repeat-containing domain protein [Xylaria longipes]
MASDDWERHKAIILHLYLLEKTPLHHVVSYMQQKHNFAKKKSQYEYQFKKWGVKTNLKKEDWQHLRHHLQKRTGIQSEVTLFGAPLSPNRVRKKTQRYSAIPTARDFGKRPPSPEVPNEMFVRVRTPTIIEENIWPFLPWFRFKNRVLPALRDPSGLLGMFFAALGSEESLFQCNENTIFQRLFDISRNPLQLRKATFHLTSMIPDDSVGGRQKAEALARKELSLSMATEMLKLVFFSLSNNHNIPYQNERNLRVHDRLVLHLIEAVSYSNPEMLSCIYSTGHCATTNAIKEAVYGSAIREKNYALVSRLLESGVDPNTNIQKFRHIECTIKRGIIELDRRFPSPPVRSGICEAAFACDIHLAKILLNAGASADSTCTMSGSALEIAAFAGGSAGASDKSAKFAQLLIEHGALIDRSASCRKCRLLKLISPIAISIARQNTHMLEVLIKEEASISLYTYSEVLRREHDNSRYGGTTWSSRVFRSFKRSYAPLDVAIISGNDGLIRRLLRPVLSYPTQASVQVVKQALTTSCLSGNADTVSKLLAHHPDILTTDEWTLGVTPLVATAWNKDITIAELLLELGAHIGPTPGNRISRTVTPTPIHVAAYHGNTSLVRHLVDRGADCNVRYTPEPPSDYHLTNTLVWLLPAVVASPLQLALWSGSGDTATLLISYHSNILGGRLVQAVNLGNSASIPDLVFEGANVLSANKNVRMLLEATVEIGNAISTIGSYFSLGGLYRSEDLYLAVRAAIKWKDYSVVRLLADHRPVGEIDRHEASSLVLSIEECEWNLVSLLLCDPFLPGPSQSYYIITDSTLYYTSINWGLRYGYPNGNRGYCGLTPLVRPFIPQPSLSSKK